MIVTGKYYASLLNFLKKIIFAVSVKKEKFYGTIKQCSSHRADRT